MSRLRPATSGPRLLPALLALLALALVAGACSTGPTGSDTAAADGSAARAEVGAFPVTIEHAYGSTEISAAPRRVVTIGWAEHDFVAALGVVPVGASKITWGGDAEGSTPWFEAKVDELGGPEPLRFDDSSGIPVDEIAGLRPDLILCTTWDMDEATYRKLSRLAPVVAFPDRPYTTDWQTSLEMIGRALGRPAAAADLREKTESVLATARAEHPELGGATFAYLSVQPTDLSQIGYLTPADPRVKVLEELGLRTAGSIAEVSGGNDSYFGTVSAERASSLTADVVVLQNVEGGPEKVLRNKLVQQVPAIGAGHVYVAPDDQSALALGGPSPLSLPWVIEHMVPGLADVAKAAKADG